METEIIDPLSEMVFDDLAPTEVPITIGKKKYVLREALADACIKYRNAMAKGSVHDRQSAKVIVGDTMASAEPIVVAACLFHVYDPNKPPRAVMVSEVLTFKGDVLKKLFERLLLISPGLVTNNEDDAKKQHEATKNGQSAGTDTSA